jgi:hypothetical protein
MNKGKAKRVVAADRLADDVGARDVQMIEKRVQIVAKDSRVAGRDSSVRKPESAEIQDEASIVPRQCRYLLPPAQVVAAAAMQEHDAGTFAMLPIVKTSIGNLKRGIRSLELPALAFDRREVVCNGWRCPIRLDVVVGQDDLSCVVTRKSGDVTAGMAA